MIRVLHKLFLALTILTAIASVPNSWAQTADPFRHMRDAQNASEVDHDAVEIAQMLRSLRSITQASSEPLPSQMKRPSELSQGKVVIYSAKFCPYAKRAIAHATSKQISFIVKDVQEDPNAARELKSLGARGVPVILMGDIQLIGFSASLFDHKYAEYEKTLVAIKGQQPAPASGKSGSQNTGFIAGAKLVTKITGARIVATPMRGSRPITELDRGAVVVFSGEEKDGFLRVTSAQGNGWVERVVVDSSANQNR